MDLEHEKRLTEIESRSKSNTKRIDDLEKRQDNLDKLVISVEKLALKEQSVEDDVKEIKKDVKEMKESPGKLWKGIVEKAIYTVVGAIITYFLFKLGIK
jgi:predicted  nucleic acid-binding Zn-ribbon protein